MLRNGSNWAEETYPSVPLLLSSPLPVLLQQRPPAAPFRRISSTRPPVSCALCPRPSLILGPPSFGGPIFFWAPVLPYGYKEREGETAAGGRQHYQASGKQNLFKTVRIITGSE